MKKRKETALERLERKIKELRYLGTDEESVRDLEELLNNLKDFDREIKDLSESFSPLIK